MNSSNNNEEQSRLTNVQQVEQSLRAAANLRARELAAAQSLQLDINSNRPESTKQTWAGKQLEFKDWNSRANYSDDLITESKFLLFITEMSQRLSHKRGRKPKNDEREDEPYTPKPVGWNTLDGYVCAVMDIWKKQHMLGRYPPNYPIPVRPPSIKEFLKNAKKAVVSRENEAFVDRGHFN